jgi:hypothetical protein
MGGALAAFDEESRLRGEVENPYGRTWVLHGIAEARLGLGDAGEATRLAEKRRASRAITAGPIRRRSGC